MKLLIVDDELWSRQLIKKVIDWNTYGVTEIVEATNGEEAITILNKESIALIITDMRMPKVDGAQLLQHVRTHNYQTEIIVMSGYEDYKYLHEALKTKAIDYLLKPIVKTEITQAVERAIDIIRENRSYQYIEEILRYEDLKAELNKYYEIKNLLYKSLIMTDEKKQFIELNRLDKLLSSQKVNEQLSRFIYTDMYRFIFRLQREYKIDNNTVNHSSNSTFEDIQDKVLSIAQEIINKEVYKKIQILDVQKYIDNHFTESITLSDIADIYHVSKEHLSRLFKKDVGISVQQYITNKKIAYGKQLLKRHKTISVSTISVMLGYLDIQYFYRVFKKETGTTPVVYRNNNINIV